MIYQVIINKKIMRTIILKENGEIMATDKTNSDKLELTDSLFEFLLKNQGQSTDYALKHGGWSLVWEEDNVPTPEEIKEYMEAHNADEVGGNDKWDYEEAEYHLLLSDKYHISN